jgi:hypothetical protein
VKFHIKSFTLKILFEYYNRRKSFPLNWNKFGWRHGNLKIKDWCILDFRLLEIWIGRTFEKGIVLRQY